MHLKNIRLASAGLLLALGAGMAQAQDAHPAPKRPFELPPSADLNYDLSARQRGFSLKGEAIIAWRAGEGRYSVRAESRVAVLGTITDDRSQGAIDAYGLAPAEFWEKRLRKSPTTTTFERASKTLSFSESEQTYPLKGGEQDRVSVTWQLAAVARAAGDRFKPGSEWPFFVAGRRDAETWTFRVVKREKVKTGLGELDAVLLERLPLPDDKDQTLQVWLAPEREWYPVKLRFTDGDKETIEQTVKTITRQ
ncbi:hypothetical protein B0920_20825 [Massilia sp. KIM]|uniref:DUF3108 domain-containing protein n=1 Tax=Massilia sp. KIM TaxID=1955422 RepID=UPI00098F1A96|nr:DUF3108 domain-containing protein [Massilia sp. KIM]OON59730.1 hypothetical protein B0920_20825 [Massilia sp. KIM]